MTYSKDTLRKIFQQPFNQQEWQTMLHKYFHAKDLRAEPERINNTPDDEAGYYLGKLNTGSYSIGLFYYQIQRGNVARKRVGLRNLVKSFINPNWGEFDAALVVFDSGSVWRLSFICDIKGENTAAKRFTYVFGESDNYYNTPVGRFDVLQRNGISFENIKDAFSVERLNKDFFNGYKERYVKFLNHINDDTKENRDYVKKLLGRLVFLQFLQKKGWMGVPANQQGWNGGDKFYLNHLIESYEGNDRLLSDVLEPLFFNTLNERRTNDLADPRLGDNIKIPYLNGGLFDKDELDKKDLQENRDNNHSSLARYMSKESVAQYLKSNTPEELHTAIDSLIKQRVVEPILQNKENARLVNKALSVVKVCDPAIGSGAFPMGVLNVLFDCRHLLYGFIGKNEDFSYAKVKRDIIQNNIYGVDIEKGAVDIARLRFWLALVVDENEPQPLPNLDYKIMCGDSLLHRFALDAPFQNVLKDYNQKNGTHYKLEDYRQWVYDYTDISDHTQKDDFRKRIEDIKRAVKTELNDKEKGKIAKVRGAIDNLQIEDMFGGKKNEKKIKALQKELKALEQQRAEIESNKIYDQAFEWRFEFPALLDENGDFMGFDIVIGNPPYIQLQNNGGQLANMYNDCNYLSFSKTGDIYCLFYELGNQLLKRKGISCYITSNKWMRAAYGEKLRDYLAGSTNPLVLVDFAGVQIFENATVDTNILLFQKNDNKGKTISCIVSTNTKDKLNDYIRKEGYISKYNVGNSWVILTAAESRIKNKIENNRSSLGESDIVLSRGVGTGFDDAYCLSGEERELLLSQCKTLEERERTKKIIHPFLRGRDIKRYEYDWKNRWMIYIPLHFPLQEDTNIKGASDAAELLFEKDYPTVYSHLLKFKDKLSARDKKETGIRYEWYCLQRPRYDKFKKLGFQKIIYQELSQGSSFAVDEKGLFLLNNSAYFIVSDDCLFLTGILNSSLIDYSFNKFYCTKLGSSGVRWLAQNIVNIPIPNATKEQKQRMDLLVKEELHAKQSKQIAMTNVLEQQIDLLVYHLYNLTYDEVLIVDPDTPITRDEYEQI